MNWKEFGIQLKHSLGETEINYDAPKDGRSPVRVTNQEYLEYKLEALLRDPSCSVCSLRDVVIIACLRIVYHVPVSGHVVAENSRQTCMKFGPNFSRVAITPLVPSSFNSDSMHAFRCKRHWVKYCIVLFFLWYGAKESFVFVLCRP
jgi:hypothetical protein